jgi:hypothetical protein
MTARTLIDQIREILLQDWDPSNAARFDAARGEYDAYLDPIAGLIQSGAGEEAIIEFLKQRESEIMCFPAVGSSHLKRIGQKLARLGAGA